MKQKKNHFMLISYDAFSCDNWAYASEQKNLKQLIEKGTYTNQLQSVYPTLTYVVHTTIATGNYPMNHGVYHNNPLQPFIPENLQDWFWYDDNIKVSTIASMATKQKKKVASILWPVTGKANIKYNIPEIRAIGDENQAIKILKNGSPLYTLSMEFKYGKTRQGIMQPHLDDFSTLCTIDTILNKKPDLLMVHLIDLDDGKHTFGTKSEEVKTIIRRMDKRIGDIVQATKEAGIYENTTFLIIGDHGQIDITHKVRLNVLLKNAGLIYEKNQTLYYDAYIQGNGGSAYLHIKDNNEEILEKALCVLEQALEENIYGIETIFKKNDIKNQKSNPIAPIIIEGKVGYAFDDSIEGEIVLDLNHKGLTYATHGFLPTKENYSCNFILSGPKIKENHEIGIINMVDIAPTIAKILDIEFPKRDGRILEEVFKS